MKWCCQVLKESCTAGRARRHSHSSQEDFSVEGAEHWLGFTPCCWWKFPIVKFYITSSSQNEITHPLSFFIIPQCLCPWTSPWTVTHVFNESSDINNSLWMHWIWKSTKWFCLFHAVLICFEMNLKWRSGHINLYWGATVFLAVLIYP